MKLHQIFINDDNTLPDVLPSYMHDCTEQLKKVYPDSEYNLYSGEDVEKILTDNFDKEIIWAYNKLKPYACKCDLARACILYLYGGLYVDLSILFINQIDKLERWEFFAFRDRNYASIRFWSVMNSIMYSKPKTKVLERVINRILNHCIHDYYGVVPVDVSATTVLGRSIVEESQYVDNQDIATLGQLYDMNQIMKLKCFAECQDVIKINERFKDINAVFYQDNNKGVMSKLIAFYKPLEGGNLKNLGFKKTNNYVQMWYNKQIYNNSEPLLHFT